jgi:hypothetical protein
MNIKKTGTQRIVQIGNGLVNLTLGSVLLVLADGLGDKKMFQYSRNVREVGRGELTGDSVKYNKGIEGFYILNEKIGSFVQ